jgi:hypothetical protein
MKLLDKYLHAVKFLLPSRNQDDIIRELSENLLSQMEDRESELGRPLTEDEQAEILRRHGHPMIVAGSYRPHQRLIGPVLFPLYLFALKVGLGVAAIVTIVLTAVSTATDHDDIPRQIIQGLLAYPGRALMVFAWTTLGFAAVDFAQARLKIRPKWDPRSLPDMVQPPEWSARGQALIELIATSAALVWLLLVPSTPVLLLGPAAAFVSLAPIWQQLYVPMVGVVVAQIALTLVTVMRPHWTPARSLARIAIHVASAIVFLLLRRGGEWVVLKPAALDASAAEATRLTHVTEIINTGFAIGLAFAVIIALIEVGRELYRWHSRRGSPLARVHSGVL